LKRSEQYGKESARKDENMAPTEDDAGGILKRGDSGLTRSDSGLTRSDSGLTRSKSGLSQIRTDSIQRKSGVSQEGLRYVCKHFVCMYVGRILESWMVVCTCLCVVCRMYVYVCILACMLYVECMCMYLYLLVCCM
jgi:hypothetical protein